MVHLVVGLGVGALAIAVTIGVLSRFPPAAEQRLWSTVLIVAAAVYLGFLAAHGVTDRWWIIEIAGFAFFTPVALAGRSGSAWPLVFGWIAHMLWDVLLHGPGISPWVPAWYPWACAVYDLVAAVWIARRLRI